MTYEKCGSLFSRADTDIRLMAATGANAEFVARSLGASTAGVKAYCARHAIALVPTPQKKRGPPKKDLSGDERAQRMVAMYRQGLTLQKIASEYDITRERVRQIVEKCGAERAGPAMRKRLAVTKAEQNKARTVARIFQRWGIDRETHREMRANGTIERYVRQQQNAKNRNIGFLLTFPQWYAIWQASGKAHLHGRGVGRYCMSRIRDDGPYELGNVHIQTNVENGREAIKQWFGKTKEHTGVFCLYPGLANPWMAKVGKQRLGFFPTIELAVAARVAYIAAHPEAKTGGFGRGKGWTLMKRSKSRPYMMQCAGFRPSYYATQAEAEAAYAAAVASKREPARIPDQSLGVAV